LLLGSDAPQIFNVPGFSAHHELEYLVQAGLTPYEALCTGTVNVARFYHAADRGMIKSGAVSDLVLLAGNPLENISNTLKVEGVMIGDKWLPKPYLEKTLQELQVSSQSN
jgi:imidazolonepropionase-like amidohydrolase